jgi:hypothetical protein
LDTVSKGYSDYYFNSISIFSTISMPAYVLRGKSYYKDETSFNEAVKDIVEKANKMYWEQPGVYK